MDLGFQQDKLDVVNKQRSNVFAWKGQFTPDLVAYLLEENVVAGETVADPFSGSGTVAIEALSNNMDCITYEINPSAFYMTSFFLYSKLTIEERWRMVDQIIRRITPIITSYSPAIAIYNDSEKDFRKAYGNLLDLATNISKSDIPSQHKPFLMNILFKCEKDKKLGLRDSFRKNFSAIRDLLYDLPESANTLSPHLADARLLGAQHPNKVDLVLTSPPYINVFNYHQNFRGIVECFDFDVLKIAQSEIGSNRKNRINRFRTVVEYAIEMGSVLRSCTDAVKLGGKIIFVVGRESMVRKTPFYNSKIILDLMLRIPALQVLDMRERRFVNRYGDLIYEDIIIAKKISSDTGTNIEDKKIGLKQLEVSLEYACKEVIGDIEEVLNNNESIKESVIYKL